MKKRQRENKSPSRVIEPSKNLVPVTIPTPSRIENRKEIQVEDKSRPNSTRQWYRWKKKDRQLSSGQQEKEIEMYEREQRLKELELAEILYEKQRIKQALFEIGNDGQCGLECIGNNKKERRLERHRRMECEKMRGLLLAQSGRCPYWTEIERRDLMSRPCQQYTRCRSEYTFSQKVRNGFYKICCQFYCWLTIILIVLCGILIFLN